MHNSMHKHMHNNMHNTVRRIFLIIRICKHNIRNNVKFIRIIHMVHNHILNNMNNTMPHIHNNVHMHFCYA